MITKAQIRGQRKHKKEKSFCKDHYRKEKQIKRELKERE